MRQTHFLLVIAIAFDGAIHDFGFARSHAIRDLGVVVMGRRRPLEGCELLCLGGVHDVDVDEERNKKGGVRVQKGSGIG